MLVRLHQRCLLSRDTVGNRERTSGNVEMIGYENVKKCLKFRIFQFKNWKIEVFRHNFEPKNEDFSFLAETPQFFQFSVSRSYENVLESLKGAKDRKNGCLVQKL